ncbi:MAG: glycosyltransferase [Anaerolineaceae bacterium]|jgi:glycosyltransferase involved in cell wall biosynthesis|nr:MAG: glycosyltransferase [Anaerolineaceae bacterium]
MKITLLHYSAPPVVGGVESVMEHHASLMQNDGHQVQIVAGRGRQVDSRIPFVSIPLVDSRHPDILSMKEELDQGRVPAGFESAVGKIEALVNEALQDTDVLIAHNVCSLNKNLALTAALFNISQKRKDLRVILWHHDLAWTTPRYRAELHEGYPWNLLKTAWNGVTQATISDMRQDELAELMGLEKSAITVTPNGVDVDKFLKLEEQTREFAGRLNLLSADPLLLLPVRITTRKNIELALKTLAHLREHYPNAQLVVTGPLGPHNPANAKYFEKLTSLRRELGLVGAAHFLAELTDEFIPDAVISDFYQLADVLFLPSFEEGFGIPILEGGLTGIPIFCSDIPPLRKLGGDFATYFSPDEDSKKVAGLMLKRLTGSVELKMKSYVRANFIWNSIYRMKIAPLLRAD